MMNLFEMFDIKKIKVGCEPDTKRAERKKGSPFPDILIVPSFLSIQRRRRGLKEATIFTSKKVFFGN